MERYNQMFNEAYSVTLTDMDKKIIDKNKSKIDKHDITIESGYSYKDWGPRKRGQGKRIGGGMVVGSMSDAPYGLKRYNAPFKKLPDIESIKDDLAHLTYSESSGYLKARSAGFTHAQSLYYALKYFGR